MNEEKCKVNGCDLQGEPIPEKDRPLFGGKTHFSQMIAISDRRLDRVVEYLCPKCGASWKRE